MISINDTIAAISTPPGEGGISVIRLSGNDAFKIAGKIFYKSKTVNHPVDINKMPSHTIHFGYIFFKDELIDEVLISVFKNPDSYTGEDVIEISSHGGTFISQKILNILFESGARHAQPGEFTKRAFLNGKIDLTQAEAVADLIKSKTDSAHASSIKQLEGSLSGFVHKSRQDIINIISLVELELDFAEEGLELVKKEELKNMITSLTKKIENITSSYLKGKVIREGVNLVIAGKPNSGKSSLFNYLLKTNRAIVSDIAGTTRDYIDERIIINGILFNLTDTAGIRTSEDVLETEGIKRTYGRISEADIILYLIDSSGEEETIREDIKHYENNFKSERTIPVFTKSDLSVKKIFENGIAISLLDDGSIENMKNKMTDKLNESRLNLSFGEITITNYRHKLCLENTVKSLREAVVSIDNKMSGEFISVDLRNAIRHLGEITGEVTNDEILNNIFRNFCIGK